MHITLIEPYFSGSHASWARNLQKYSSHEIQILSLKGFHWKWRMFGGAVSLADKFRREVKHTDLILATDMLDLATFLGLTKDVTHDIPTAIYFHENQLTYPWSEKDTDIENNRLNEYAFKNYTSALVADRVFFNSNYHLNSFLGELPNFLRQFPDYRKLDNVDKIKNKSEVLNLGVELNPISNSGKRWNEIPRIVWNHRWEYDKNPNDFFDILLELKDTGFKFKLMVMGETFKNIPSVFNQAKEMFQNEIIHFGYCENKTEYHRLLQQGDILPVTSKQDFFGASVIEGMAAGMIPLIPNRLVYPEHIPVKYHQDFIYEDKGGLINKIRTWTRMKNKFKRDDISRFVQKYNWSEAIENYDACFSNIFTSKK